MREMQAKCKQNPKSIPSLPKPLRGPRIAAVKKEEYISLPDDKKLEFEMALWQNCAILSARLANIYNRKAHSSQDVAQQKRTQMAFSRKLLYSQEFLISAVNHNEIAKNIGLENDQIVFGFDKDEKGSVFLEACLPGFTRLSVHFGSPNNFRTICDTVDKKVPISFNWYDIINEDKFRFNLPRFGLVNTGIINTDDNNGSHELAKQFKQKSRNPDGSIDIEGMRDFIFFMNSGLGLNNREVFQLAELAGLGKGFLEQLTELLPQRTQMQEQANKEGITMTDLYVRQSLAQTRNQEEEKKLLHRLWNCRKLELGEVSQDDREEFKKYLLDLMEANKNSNGRDLYAQLYEIAEQVSQSEIEQVNALEAFFTELDKEV